MESVPAGRWRVRVFGVDLADDHVIATAECIPVTAAAKRATGAPILTERAGRHPGGRRLRASHRRAPGRRPFKPHRGPRSPELPPPRHLHSLAGYRDLTGTDEWANDLALRPSITRSPAGVSAAAGGLALACTQSGRTQTRMRLP